MSEKVWNFINRRKFEIFFLVTTLISIIIRIQLINYESNDMKRFLLTWFNELKNNGGILALNLNLGDYNISYLIILAILTYLPIKPIISIKIVSIIFDYVCAISVGKIVGIIFKNDKNRRFLGVISYSVVLFLPTVILNSAYWGQSDSIYVSFILISLYYLIKKKYFKSFIFLGISFAFKLQCIFILPLYILVYISERKFSILYFLIIPLINFIVCLPAIILGRSITSCLDIYINQSSEYSSYLSLNFTNIYNIFFPSSGNFVITPNENFVNVGILVTFFVLILLAFIILYKKVKFDGKAIIEFGLLSIMITTFLLPSMHDRYLFAGDILSVLYFLCNRDKIYVPIGITLISMYAYTRYLFGSNLIMASYISLTYLVIIVFVVKDICKKYFFMKGTSINEKNFS